MLLPGYLLLSRTFAMDSSTAACTCQRGELSSSSKCLHHMCQIDGGMIREIRCYMQGKHYTAYAHN